MGEEKEGQVRIPSRRKTHQQALIHKDFARFQKKFHFVLDTLSAALI
jgi:hypothetical protein